MSEIKRRLKGLSLLCLFVCLAIFLLAVFLVGYFDWSVPLKEIRITWRVSVPYAVNYVIAVVMAIVFYFLFPKKVLARINEMRDYWIINNLLLVLSLLMSYFFVFLGFIIFFVLTVIIYGISYIIIDCKNSEDVNRDKTKCVFQKMVLGKIAFSSMLLFIFAISLMKGVVVGVFFELFFLAPFFAYYLLIVYENKEEMLIELKKIDGCYQFLFFVSLIVSVVCGMFVALFTPEGVNAFLYPFQLYRVPLTVTGIIVLLTFIPEERKETAIFGRVLSSFLGSVIGYLLSSEALRGLFWLLEKIRETI